MGQIQRYFTQYTTEPDQPMVEGNSRIAYIQNKFLFSMNDITKLQELFRQMDKNGTGYIGQNNFFEFLDEELDSIISPYAEYLFLLIDKEIEQKVSFQEWLPSISLYCLYSQDSVVGFVFQLLDSDHDNYISKKDLMSFLVQKRNSKKIFYYNYMKAVELLDIERPDKISLEQFRKLQSQIPFICYPAFRLQRELRNKIFGYKYWEKLYERILHKENEENKKKQLHKIQEEMRKKQQNKLDKKIEKFIQNTHVPHQTMQSIRIQGRMKKKRNSDAMVSMNQDKVQDFIQNVYQKLSKQKGTLNILEIQDLKTLRCNSRSLEYIKTQFKETEQPIPIMQVSNQYIKQSTSQQKITVKIRNSRKSIFHDVGNKRLVALHDNYIEKSRSKSFVSSCSEISEEAQ